MGAWEAVGSTLREVGAVAISRTEDVVLMGLLLFALALLGAWPGMMWMVKRYHRIRDRFDGRHESIKGVGYEPHVRFR
jgi:hypothetical protein